MDQNVFVAVNHLHRNSWLEVGDTDDKLGSDAGWFRALGNGSPPAFWQLSGVGAETFTLKEIFGIKLSYNLDSCCPTV